MEIDWQQVLLDHGPAVWKTVRRLVGNEADARDVYQVTFLEAFQFTQESPVDDWIRLLRRIARMRAMDLLRKRYRRATRFEPEAVLERAVDTEPAPEARMVKAELSEQLRFALTRLTDQQAEVFVMRHVEELPYEEIALRTDSNRNAVGVMLNRARKQLRELLVPYVDSQADARSMSQEPSS